MRRKINILKKNISAILAIFVFLTITSYSTSIFIQNQKELESKNKELNLIKTQFNSYSQLLENITSKINILKNQDKTKLEDPTYDEALSFIFNDRTNENTYNSITYNCVHFSTDVNNNAEKKGIRCAFVELILTNNYPHAIVAFNTTDKGLVFFEPQLDEKAEIEIGKDYWQDCLENSTSLVEGNLIVSYTLYW